MKNNIQQYTANDPVVQKLKSIERRLSEYKHTQAPTVKLSNTSSVSFTAFNDFAAFGGFPDATAIATLSPPTDQVIMALPEWSLYFGGVPAEEDEESLTLASEDRVYPGSPFFSNPSGLPQWWNNIFDDPNLGHIYITTCWWYDYWESILDPTELKSTYRLRLDGGLMNRQSGTDSEGESYGPNADYTGFNLTLTSRWRYLLPGAGV